jgi:hypothetical protein
MFFFFHLETHHLEAHHLEAHLSTNVSLHLEAHLSTNVSHNNANNHEVVSLDFQLKYAWEDRTWHKLCAWGLFMMTMTMIENNLCLYGNLLLRSYLFIKHFSRLQWNSQRSSKFLFLFLFVFVLCLYLPEKLKKKSDYYIIFSAVHLSFILIQFI